MSSDPDPKERPMSRSRRLLLIAVLTVVASFMLAGTAFAAPLIPVGWGWVDGPHGSYPGYCLNCHTGFTYGSPPTIVSGTAPTHHDRGSNCAQCHTIKPATPASPKAVAISTTSIAIGWAKSSGAASYRVMRSATSTGTFTQIGTATTTKYTDAGRTAGQTMYYRIVAVSSTNVGSAASAIVSARTFAPSTLRVSETASPMTYTGTWTTRMAAACSGGSAKSSSASASKVAFSFRGTAITWWGSRGPSCGKAQVSVDGTVVATVDLYAATATDNVAVFRRSGMTNGPHTVAIVVSSMRNAGSMGNRVDVDGFSMTGISPGLMAEETKGVFTGLWTSKALASYSGGTARVATSTASAVSYTFTGTGVTLIGMKSPGSGKASVYVDGVLAGTVDEYASATAYRLPLFSKSGLAFGSHVIKVVPTGTRNTLSTSATFNVDAFCVR
jgi:hypothetical protein